MSVFNSSRIDNYRTKCQTLPNTNGILYLFEPTNVESIIVDLHDEKVTKAFTGTFRFYMKSHPIYDRIESIETFSIINFPESEVRCFSNGIVEVFSSPIVKRNLHPPNILQVRFDNIVGSGRRHNEVIQLMRHILNCKDDIDLHITMFGVRNCFPYSMESMRLRAQAFNADVVALPVLQISSEVQTDLQVLMKKHIYEDTEILTDLF